MSKQSDQFLRNIERMLVVLSCLTSIHSRILSAILNLREDDIGNDASVLLQQTVSRYWLQFQRCGFLSWVSSAISVTYLFIPFTIITHERVPSPNEDLIMISIPSLLHRSSCLHGSILSLWIIVHLEVMCTLDMSHTQICQFHIVEGREKLSLRQSLHNPCIGAQFDQLNMIWKICEFSFILAHQVSLHRLIGPRRFCSLSAILLALLPWSPNCSEQQVFPVLSLRPEILQASSYPLLLRKH